MKIFAVRDEEYKPKKDLAYLFYHEKKKRFYIELPVDADEWETPLLLSAFAAKGQLTINSYWSMRWVQNRIIPKDRQNIVSILRDAKLSAYDEFELLRLAKGRCAQDSYRIHPIDEKQLPEYIQTRLSNRIEDVVPLNNFKLLIFLKNGVTRKIGLQELVGNERTFAKVLADDYLFRGVNVNADGFSIGWGDNLEIMYDVLANKGVLVPLDRDDFISFIDYRVVSTGQIREMLDCTRQNVNYLVEKQKLTTINKDSKVRLFLKQDLLNVMG